MKLGKKENEILFILSMITFIVYGFYALLTLITESSIPLFVSLTLLTSLLITIFLSINYELNFSDLETNNEEEQIELDSNLIRI